VKKILLTFLISLLLISNSFAETIILKCRNGLYKYVKEGNTIKAFQANPKEKDRWWEWPKVKVQKDNKHFLKFTDTEAIIDGYIVTEKFKKIVWKGGFAENGRTIVDFKKKTYDSKAMTKKGPWKKKAKCKLQK
jgi:hypothetical protein|tara:strand:- start:459 stop:860 length:402 start_codon:yes stop_codon:yes gene_type:complete